HLDIPCSKRLNPRFRLKTERAAGRCRLRCRGFMKTCPYCAEEIQDAAIKCKHCGSRLDTPSVDVNRPMGEWNLNYIFRVIGVIMLILLGIGVFWAILGAIADSMTGRS